MSQLHRVKWAARQSQCAARPRRDPPPPLRRPLIGSRHRCLRKAARGPTIESFCFNSFKAFRPSQARCYPTYTLRPSRGLSVAFGLEPWNSNLARSLRALVDMFAAFVCLLALPRRSPAQSSRHPQRLVATQLHSCGHRSYVASPGEICRVTAPRQLFHKDVEMLKLDFRPFPVILQGER
eukprot:2246342-Pleurochrysis_carterae.AAC.1